MAFYILALSFLLSISLAIKNLYSSSIAFLLLNWRDIKSTKLLWRSKYPSHKEMYTLFDRGDIMLASIFIAVSLQLSHSEISKVLRAHSAYKTNLWRRVARTVWFIHIWLQSNTSERQQVIIWLRSLHKPIPLFLTEASVIVTATMAYGIVKTHEFLGVTTSQQADSIVATVMSLADELDLKIENGQNMPGTVAELEEYLHRELPFDPDEPLKNNLEFWNLLRIRGKNETMKGLVTRLVRMPLTSLATVILKIFIWELAHNALAQRHLNRGTIGQPFWWCIRKVHRFLTTFHYSVCPHMLTIPGTLDLMSTADPVLETVFMDLHLEIFGKRRDYQQFLDTVSHTPRMRVGAIISHTAPEFRQDIIELIKCAYYRGKIAPSVGHQIKHLGIIMDGNRRYAKDTRLDSVLSGHTVGAVKLLDVIPWTLSSGIQNLTVWVLSNDNLKRGPSELSLLFSMVGEYVDKITAGILSLNPGVRVRVIGDRSIMPEHLRETIAQAEAATAQNSTYNIQLAIGYGGRSEVVRATKLAVNAKMVQEGLSLEEAIAGLNEPDVSHQVFSAQLGLPPIDAILRTSGENRLSGFALWESQHAEFAIVKENWPALKQSTFLRTLVDLSKRNRRLGA